MNTSPGNVWRFCLLVLLTIAAGGVLISHAWNASAKPQQQAKTLQYDVRVINIEVPVRVFSGDSFIDSLKLTDFEVYENGVIQNLEAAYLVKTTSISRKEENQAFNPETSRAFYLFFVLYDYDPRIREALAFFVNNVLHPGDRLFVVTPHATYRMRAETLAAAPKERIVDQLTGIIRKDVLTENLGYRNTLSNLKRMARSNVRPIEGQTIDPGELAEMGLSSKEEYLMQLRSDMAQLEELRKIDESKLFNFATYLKDQKGQKLVFLFYQREFTPTPDKNTQAAYENDPVLKQLMEDVAGAYKRISNVAVDRLKKAYADSSITINFLYLTTVPTDISRAQMEERSWDVYQSFSEMAKATGGLISSSSNTVSLMEKASSASENYYLLYYSPKDKTADGKFREILVKVKTGGYRVTHLAGYFAK